MKRSFRFGQSPIRSSDIRPLLTVVCSKGIPFGIVDRVEAADFIKLAKDQDGQYHYIPVSWVTKVDDKVHVDRSADQVTREWTTTPRRS